MANHAVGQAAAGLSVLLGMFVIAGSALFLKDWRKPYEDCSNLVGGGHELCNPMRYFVVGAATGIIAGILQMFTSLLGFMRKGKAWALAQILVVFLLICAYAVPVSEDAYNLENTDFPHYSVYRWRALAFLGVTSVDIVCTLVLMLIAFMAS